MTVTSFTIAIVIQDEKVAWCRGVQQPAAERALRGCRVRSWSWTGLTRSPSASPRPTGRGDGAGGTRDSSKSLCKKKKKKKHLCKAWAIYSASSEILYVACNALKLGTKWRSRCRCTVMGAPEMGALWPDVNDAYKAHLHYCLLPVTFYLSTKRAGGRKTRQKALKTSYDSMPKLHESCFTSDVVSQPGRQQACRGRAESKAAANQYPALAAWKIE